VAIILGIDRASVSRLAREKKLKSIRIGRKMFFVAAEVFAYVQQQKQK
jgi:excisionase family DNA binding protein